MGKRKSRIFSKGTILFIIGMAFFCSMFGQSSVNAVSQFDDALSVTDNIQVGGGYYTDTCAPIDVTEDWLDRIKNNATYAENPNVRAGVDGFYENLEYRISTGSGWFVASQRGSSTAPASLFVAEFDPNVSVNFGYYLGDMNLPELQFSASYRWLRFKQRIGDCKLVLDELYPMSNNQFIIKVNSSPQILELYQFASNNVNYPSGYEGLSLPTPDSSTDVDQDGLDIISEVQQGTSDAKRDTDGDGLSDYVEWQGYPARNDVFCGSQCAYPTPTVKDLYVEVDWTEKNSRDYVPSASQISDVVDAYSNQGILAHFDAGQFGGGEQVLADDVLTFAPTENELDFYDIKNGTSSITPKFDSNRKNIWHYMITGPNFMETDGVDGSTGASTRGMTTVSYQ